MTLLSDWGMASIMIEMTLDVNRAFSAWCFDLIRIPGALPQAKNEIAPLALNTNRFAENVRKLPQAKNEIAPLALNTNRFAENARKLPQARNDIAPLALNLQRSARGAPSTLQRFNPSTALSPIRDIRAIRGSHSFVHVHSPATP